MTGSSGPSEPTADRSDARLAAEEAAADYWRGVAADRRIEAARVQHRPVVRAAIAIDRRSRPLQDRLASAARAGRAAGARLATRAVPGLGTAPADAPAGRSSAGEGPAATIVAIAVADPPDPAIVDRAVAAASTDVVVLLAPAVGAEPGWLEPLARAFDDPRVVAAVPVSLFAAAPRSAHSGQVRSAGAACRLVDDSPVSAPLPAAGAAPTVVDLAVGGAVAFRRSAWDGVGGLTRWPDVTAAFVDLGLRLGADGGDVVAVGASRVTESDAPTRPVELRERPVSDSPGWSALVDRHGPRLRRLARAAGHPTQVQPWSATVTAATPSRKIAAHSGDWHYAGLFVDALTRAGVDAIRQPIAEVTGAAGRSRDVHVVLRGLEPVRRVPGQVHVLWVISHPEALTIEECDAADLVLVASRPFADHLRSLTSTPVEVFEQATEPRRFRPEAAGGDRAGIAVVANTRGVRRTAVDAAIAAGHRPTIHGLGWEGLVDPALLGRSYVPFEELPALYAGAAIVLNDHWETMRLWGFASNRILDATAAGAVVVSDEVDGLRERFDGLIPTWRTPAELGAILDELAADPVGAAARAEAARAIVLAGHTFDHRVAELDVLLHRHGLHPTPDDQPPSRP